MDRPSHTKSHPALLQPARQAAVLGQPSSVRPNWILLWGREATSKYVLVSLSMSLIYYVMYGLAVEQGKSTEKNERNRKIIKILMVRILP